MNGYIFLFLFLGWTAFHLFSIKKFNEATPGLSAWNSFKGYFSNDLWGFLISVIFLIVLSLFISFGMTDILTTILGIPAEYQTDRLQYLLAFYMGLQIQFVIRIFTKSNPIDSRTLPAEVQAKIGE